MNKFLTKIIGASLAIAMMIGVGAGVNANKPAKEVNAAGSDEWTQVTSLSGLNTSDSYVIANNANKGNYFNGSVNNGHLQTSAFSASLPAGTNASGVFKLEAINAEENIYKIKLTSTSKYVDASKASSGGFRVAQTSDSFGWKFISNGTNFDAVYQKSYSGSYASMRCYNNTSFRSYANNSASSISTSSGTVFRIYKHEEAKTLSDISVATAPTKTTYYAGEYFDPTGLVITRTYSDSTSDTYSYADHANDFAFEPSTSTALTVQNTSITITYGGKTATQAITVNAPRTMTGIELHGAINKTEYYVGDSWDLSGLDIKVNWSEGDPTFVDFDDNDVVYECNPATATSTSIDSFDIEVIYGDFDETFPIDGLSVVEHPLIDTLDKDTIPSSAIGAASSSWGTWTEVTDYTYSVSSTDGAKYKVRLMGPGSNAYVGRMNDSTNGGFYTSKAPVGVKIKTIAFSSIVASRDVSVYLSNEAYDGLPATTDYKATLTSAKLSYTVEGTYSCFAIRGRGSSLDVGALTIEYEEINPSISATPSSITLSSNGTQNVEVSIENYTSVPTLECNVQSGASSIASATVGAVNNQNKATAVITATNIPGNAVVRVRDASHPNDYYADINVTVESAKNVIENTIETNSSLAYHYSKTGAAVDRLDKAFTENTKSSYTDWSGKTGSSGAVYAGNTYGGAENIQLKSSDSISGIVTTGSAGYARKITVVWNSGTANGRTIDVYGKNSAYETAADLYTNSKGTKIGSIEKGTSTSLTITDDYEFIGIRSNSGGLNIESIDVQWGEFTYTYSNISMRFGGSIDKDLWNELDTDEHLIAGVGVMITGYQEQQRSPYSIKDHAAEAVPSTEEHNINTQVVDYYVALSSLQAMPEKNNEYYWNLKYSIDSINDMLDAYTAAAYIKLTNGELVFLKQVKYSVWSLAKDYLDNRNCDEETAGGSLYNLVNNMGLE